MSIQTDSTLAPKRALIVIDVQNDYVTGNLRIEFPPVETSLSNIALAMVQDVNVTVFGTRASSRKAASIAELQV